MPCFACDTDPSYAAVLNIGKKSKGDTAARFGMANSSHRNSHKKNCP